MSTLRLLDMEAAGLPHFIEFGALIGHGTSGAKNCPP
jgi:hypothetical protein